MKQILAHYLSFNGVKGCENFGVEGWPIVSQVLLETLIRILLYKFKIKGKCTHIAVTGEVLH